MATITNNLTHEEFIQHGYNALEDRYLVVHPLDDRPEDKVDTENLGPMPMTRAVRFSLLTLRAYLLLMLTLVIYHVLQLGGLFGGAH